MADNIIYPTFDVLFEGEEKTHRAKFIKDKPSINALMYEAADTRFYIDYDYLKECKKNNTPAIIPMKVIEKQKKWEEEVEQFKKAWAKSHDLTPTNGQPSRIITPTGFDRGDQKS